MLPRVVYLYVLGLRERERERETKRKLHSTTPLGPCRVHLGIRRYVITHIFGLVE